MKNFTKLIILLLLTLSLKAEMFAGYDEFCGLPVIIGTDNQIATARKDPYGNKYIHIDPNAMNNWTSSRIFTLAHECAHHLLGHTSRLGKIERYNGGTAKQELEADCWAAKKLYSIGYEYEIKRTMFDNIQHGHFSTNGYPSGIQRFKNIKNCINNTSNNCEIVIEPCMHLLHPRGDKVNCNHYIPQHPRGDIVPCSHPCYSPYGAMPCHPNGDIIPCRHKRRAHQFDVVPCTHIAHPRGHKRKVCG